MVTLAWFTLVAEAGLEAQVRLTLEEAGSRRAPEQAPAYEGQELIVTGEVPYRPIPFLDFSHLHIQDDTFHGLTLEGPVSQFAGLAPGDVIEVRGMLTNRSGLPVVLPSEIRRVGSGPARAPQRISLEDLATWRYLGVLVNTEGRIEDKGFDAGGEYLILGREGKRVRVYLPRRTVAARPAFDRLHKGDRVRVGGVASQFCVQAPYTSGFELLVDDPEAVSSLESAAFLSPWLLAGALLLLTALFGFWRLREHRLTAQRGILRSLNALGEELIGAGTPVQILRRLNQSLPKVTGVTGVRLYLYRRSSKSLERIPLSADQEALAVPLEAPGGDAVSTGAAVCFKNRTPINIPDARRSPFFRGVDRGDVPRSVLFVPMFSQSECLGVLEIDHAHGLRFFSRDEQGATQHLANQIATALKLEEQQSMREHLFRTEKLAAAGQLISGVADELRTPLRSIASLTQVLLARSTEVGMERDLRAIAHEALRAAEIVEHLVSFTRVEEAEAKTIDLHRLLGNLVQFREREWKNRGVQVHNRLPAEPLLVVGSQSQLEQVFLNLLVHSEQSMAHAPDKIITLTTARLAKRVLVEIAYSETDEEPAADPFHDERNGKSSGLGLGVCRGIIHGHGGDIRLVRVPGQGTRFEVELPLALSLKAPEGGGSGRHSARSLTILLVEPEPASQRQLIALLSNGTHRVVPVSSGEEVAELVQRLRFDGLFCSIRLPGMNWVELFERVRGKVGSFVLLTEGYNGDLIRAFQGGEGFVLSKPAQEDELSRLLEAIESRVAANSPAVPARG